MGDLQDGEDLVVSTVHGVNLALGMEMFVRRAEINLNSDALTERTLP